MTAGEQLQKLRRKAKFALARFEYDHRHCRPWKGKDPDEEAELLEAQITFLFTKLCIIRHYQGERTKPWGKRKLYGEVSATYARGSFLSAPALPGEVS